MAVLVDNVEFPPVANERAAKGARGVGEFRTLLSRPLFMFGVAAQFFCATAQVGLWSFTIRYVQNAMPGNLVTSAADILLWSLFAFTVGRFVGAALMYWIDPDRLLAVYAGVSAVLTAIAALAGGGYGVTCVAATSFFLSIMFPIFAGSIRDLGTLTKSGAAFLVMAAGGGVAALAIMNLVWGLSSIQYVMLVPSISFAVVLAFAIANQRAAKGM
jgi:FHS family L-fucose permease-like MFS transporter